MIDRETREALPTNLINKLDRWEQGLVPTLLEMKVGSPQSFEGITPEARQLKGFAMGLKNTINDVGTVFFRAYADGTMNDSSKLDRSATFANKKIEDARKQFATLVSNTTPTIDRLNESFRLALKPPTTAGEASIDSELRAWVKGLDPAKVAGELRANPAALAAVARAPSVLSGLNKDLHAELTKEHLAVVMPSEFNQHEELVSLIRGANQALSTLEEESKKLIDFESASKIGARKFVEL